LGLARQEAWQTSVPHTNAALKQSSSGCDENEYGKAYPDGNLMELDAWAWMLGRLMICRMKALNKRTNDFD